MQKEDIRVNCKYCDQPFSPFPSNSKYCEEHRGSKFRTKLSRKSRTENEPYKLTVNIDRNLIEVLDKRRKIMKSQGKVLIKRDEVASEILNLSLKIIEKQIFNGTLTKTRTRCIFCNRQLIPDPLGDWCNTCNWVDYENRTPEA